MPFDDSASLAPKALTLDALKQCFHLPSDQACRKLGVGLTVLKRQCRLFHIPRWPYRKHASLTRLIADASATDPAHARSATVLRTMRAAIETNGKLSAAEDGRVQRMRQVYSKARYAHSQPKERVNRAVVATVAAAAAAIAALVDKTGREETRKTATPVPPSTFDCLLAPAPNSLGSLVAGLAASNALAVVNAIVRVRGSRDRVTVPSVADVTDALAHVRFGPLLWIWGPPPPKRQRTRVSRQEHEVAMAIASLAAS